MMMQSDTRLVGMTETDAVALLRARNLPARVLQRGNKRFPVHDDYHPNRCNLIVEADGRVSKATHDVGEKAFMLVDTDETGDGVVVHDDTPPISSTADELIGLSERVATARLCELGATYQRITHHIPPRVSKEEFCGITLCMKEGFVHHASSSYVNNRLVAADAAVPSAATTLSPDDGDEDVSDLYRLVGMAEADAVRLLQAFGAKPRVVQRGAEMYFGTDDICFKRCNLNVDADGRVVEAWHDMGSAFPDAIFRACAMKRSKDMAEWRREIARIGGSREQQVQYFTRMLKQHAYL